MARLLPARTRSETRCRPSSSKAIFEHPAHRLGAEAAPLILEPQQADGERGALVDQVHPVEPNRAEERRGLDDPGMGMFDESANPTLSFLTAEGRAVRLHAIEPQVLVGLGAEGVALLNICG